MDDNSQLGEDGKPFPKNSTEIKDTQEDNPKDSLENENQGNKDDINGDINDINKDDNQNIGEDNNFPENENNDNINDINDENNNFPNPPNDDFNNDNNFKDEENNENNGTFRFSEANNENNRFSNTNNNNFNESQKDENDFEFVNENNNEDNNNNKNNNSNFNENIGGENNNDDNFGFRESDLKDNNINNNKNEDFNNNQYNENDFNIDNNNNINNNNIENDKENNNIDMRGSLNSENTKMKESNNPNNLENKSRLLNKPKNSNFINNNNNNFNYSNNPYNSSPNNNNNNQNGGTNFGLNINPNQTTSNFIPQNTYTINNLNNNYSTNYNNNTVIRRHADYSPSFEHYVENPEDNDGFHIDPNKTGKYSSTIAGAQIANVIMGAGILSIPIIMSFLGLLVGIILIAFSSLSTFYSVYILLRCHQITGKSGYSMFGKITLGKVGAIIVKIIIIINYLGLCVAYLRIFGESLMTILLTLISPNSYFMTNWHNYIYIFLGSIIMIFTVFIKKITSLKKVAYLGIITALLFAFAITILLFYKGVGGYLDNDISWDLLFPNCTFTEAFHAIPTVFIAFLFQLNVFPIYYSLKHRSMQSMMRATKIGIGFSFLIFLIIGIVSLYLYAFDTDDTILESFTDDMKYYRDDNVFIIVLIIIICITFIIACLTSFPILFLSLRLNFINSIITCMKSCGQGKHHSQEVQISQSNNHKKKNYINEKVFVLVTILLYFLIIVIAIFIYRIRAVFTIVGLSAGTFITFIFPNIFYIIILKKTGKKESIALPIIFIGIGIFFFLISFYFGFY